MADDLDWEMFKNRFRYTQKFGYSFLNSVTVRGFEIEPLRARESAPYVPTEVSAQVVIDFLGDGQSTYAGTIEFIAVSPRGELYISQDESDYAVMTKKAPLWGMLKRGNLRTTFQLLTPSEQKRVQRAVFNTMNIVWLGCWDVLLLLLGIKRYSKGAQRFIETTHGFISLYDVINTAVYCGRDDDYCSEVDYEQFSEIAEAFDE